MIRIEAVSKSGSVIDLVVNEIVSVDGVPWEEVQAGVRPMNREAIETRLELHERMLTGLMTVMELELDESGTVVLPDGTPVGSLRADSSGRSDTLPAHD